MAVASLFLTTVLVYLYLYFLLKKHKEFLVFGFIIFFEMVWMFYSIAYIDTGALITELGRTSYFTGASIRLLLIYIPFLTLTPLLTSRFARRLAKTPSTRFLRVKHIEEILQFVLLGIEVYTLLDMLLTGIPLFSNYLTRMNYFSYSKLPAVSMMIGEVTYFLMLVNGKKTFDKGTSRKKRMFGFFLIGFCLLERMMLSYKFDGVYQVVLMFATWPLYSWIRTAKLRRILSFRNVLKVIAIVFAVLGFCYFSYSITNPNSVVIDLLFSRIFAFQSHTWWGTDLNMYVKAGDIGMNLEQLALEWQAILNGSGVWDKTTGLVKVMYNVGYSSTVDAYLQMGARFYGNFVTVAVGSLGYVGTAVYSVLVSLMAAYAVANVKSALEKREYVLLYLSISFLLDVIDYFRIGNFCLILNVKTLIVLTLLLGVNHVKRFGKGLKRIC